MSSKAFKSLQRAVPSLQRAVHHGTPDTEADQSFRIVRQLAKKDNLALEDILKELPKHETKTETKTETHEPPKTKSKGKKPILRGENLYQVFYKKDIPNYAVLMEIHFPKSKFYKKTALSEASKLEFPKKLFSEDVDYYSFERPNVKNAIGYIFIDSDGVEYFYQHKQ